MSRAADLAAVLETAPSLAIVCHDNPDPDCLASAIALEAIAHDQGVDDVTIGYGGEISHQQNRAFVTMLDIDLEHVDGVDIDAYDCVAFVDHSRPGVTTQLDASVEPDVVIDHHPDGPIDAAFVDVRPEIGATSTLLVEYLVDLEVELTSRLASGLLFALHRERLDYVRRPTRREYEAALEMYSAADLEVLDQLYGSAFTPATLDAIGHAITSRERRGSSLVASVGVTTETDALPQAADYLLNLEGVDTVLAYGIIDDVIRLSGRSYDPRVHIGRTLETAYGELGPAGGHHDMAGGHIDLGLFADDAGDEAALLEFVGTRLTTRFFDALNLEEEP